MIGADFKSFLCSIVETLDRLGLLYPIGGSVFDDLIERILNGAGRQVAGLYGKVSLNVQVEWQAPLPNGPKIIAANHPTTTDPFLLMGLIGEPMSILITESCFKLPGLRAFLRAAGRAW